MEDLRLPMEPLLQPSQQRKALLSLAMGGAAALLLALVGLFIPTAQLAASWIVGFLLGQLLLYLWRRASYLSDAACFAVGVVAGGGSSLLTMSGCLLLARIAPTAVGLGCTANYLRAAVFANAYGIIFCTWVLGWGWLRWYTWGLTRREKKARQYMEQFGGKRDGHA